MDSVLYYDGVFHSGLSREDAFSCMSVSGGVITGTYRERPEGLRFTREVSLGGRHVYPCLIDGHIHLLFTIAVMAMGFNICEIGSQGVTPDTMSGVAAKVRDYASRQKKGAVIAANNYILTAVDERRMPTREELDDWAGGRPMVMYNIDGHSTSLSSAMLRLIGIEPEGHSGVLQGEENERVQGRLTDVVGAHMTLPLLAKGIAAFQNACAAYGIGVVGALEGNGDSPRDPMTALLVRLAGHFDVGVRFYFQYVDIKRAERFARYQKHPRIGGCGDWEMDGATGSHSAAFRQPYRDTGKTSPCYYEQDFVNALVREADEKGYQIASHAIGELAIERIIEALDRTSSGRLHRIEHCEFHSDASLEDLKKCRYAVMMQPGYAWIDKRYLHTYTQFLPQEIVDRLKFKTLYDAGICLCASSDSPVQDLDPYLQMLGMTDFYNPAESIGAFDAFRAYTLNPARALLEEDELGTLEPGKRADFFTAERDMFALSPSELADFRPVQTYYGGKPYRVKRGSVGELALSLLGRRRAV